MSSRILGNPLPGLVQQWRQDLEAHGVLDQLQSRRVLFFTGGLNLLEHGLATAFALAHRNCDIQFVWLPNLRPDQPDDRYSRRKFKFYYAKALVELSQHPARLTGTNLEDVPASPVTALMTDLAKAQAYIDTVYITRRERIDVEGRDRQLFEWRVRHGTDVLSRLKTIIQRVRPDVLVTPNGGILEFGLAYRFCQSIGLSVGTYEFWGGAGEGSIAFGPSVMSVPTEELWARNEPHELDTSRRVRAIQILQQRQGTQSREFSAEELRKKLDLRPNTPVVLVCPNVPFDALFLGETTTFKSMRSWLAATVKHLTYRSPLINIVVRAHPHEPSYEPEETSLSILREELGPALRQVCFVQPTDRVNTYELMKIADLGLVFSSTTGLEMAALGVPVVCGNLFHYNRKGFTYDPRSPKEYFEMIDGVLDNSRLRRLTGQQVEKALSYLEIFFNQFPLSFPWRFGDYWHRLREWPLSRVISAKGDLIYGRTFDTLVGRPTGGTDQQAKTYP